MSDPLSKAATATEIARAIAGGKVKAAAVIDATLKRIAASEPTINAFTDVVAERAIQRAAEIDAGKHRGPLMGVPFAVKDNIDAAGWTTTAACPAFAYTARDDAHVVALLRSAGAILLVSVPATPRPLCWATCISPQKPPMQWGQSVSSMTTTVGPSPETAYS